MDKIEEIEARRAARKEELAKAEKEQLAKDLEARDALEVEHGDGDIAAVKVSKFKSGHPTMALLKTPTGAQYKRYVDQIGRAVEKKNSKAQRDAQELLAQSCWVYPDPKDAEARAAMLEAFPGLLTSIAIAASAMAEGRTEEEGKG